MYQSFVPSNKLLTGSLRLKQRGWKRPGRSGSSAERCFNRSCYDKHDRKTCTCLYQIRQTQTEVVWYSVRLGSSDQTPDAVRQIRTC